MALSVWIFLVLLAAVGATRLVELAVSRRHRRVLAQAGVRPEPDPYYPLMVALQSGVLLGAGVEVVLLRRPFITPVALAASVLFLLAAALRWWAIRSLGGHWNVQVMDSVSIGVVARGPFRWVRHPNYLGVFVELVALPLVHAAWITAFAAAIGNALILKQRLRIEEPMLESHAEYRAVMAGKPRFLPGIF
jgi:methyltransferase